MNFSIWLLDLYQCCQCDVRLCRSCFLSPCRCWRRPAWWGSAAAPRPACAAGWWCWRDGAAPLSSAAGWKSPLPAATSLQGALGSRLVKQISWHALGASGAGASRRRWWSWWGLRTWGAPRSGCQTEEPPGGEDCMLVAEWWLKFFFNCCKNHHIRLKFTKDGSPTPNYNYSYLWLHSVWNQSHGVSCLFVCVCKQPALWVKYENIF